MRRTIELIVAAGTAALLTIAYLVYVARTIGPAEYADFSAALSVIYFFSVALSPVAPTLARIVARRMARGEEAAVASLRRELMGRMATACALAAVAGVVAAPFVARWLKFRSPAPLIAAFGAGLLFAVLSADRGVLQGLMRFSSYNANVLLEAAVRAGGAVVVMRASGDSAAAALISYVLALLIAEMIIAFSLHRRWRAIRAVPVDWAEVHALAGPMLLLMVAAAAFQNLDMLAVKRWLPAEDAGRYGAAVAIARSFAVVFVPLYVLSGPLLSTARERNEPIVAPAVRLSLLYVALCVPALAVLLFWPDPVIRLLFGADFTGLSSAVVVLGGITILIHTTLLLTQVLITVEEFGFLAIYAAAVIAEVIGLVLFHESVSDVLMVAWVTQVGLLVAISYAIIRRRFSWDAT
jgi:O-antigen/teichoic acid export membrane protein